MRINSLLVLLPLLAIVLRVASAPTANASFLIIALYALFGPAQAVHALALSWLFTMINPGIAPEASAATVGRYLVIFAAATAVVWNNGGFAISRTNALTLLLGAFFIGHALFFSSIVGVSVLKIASWLVVVLTLLSAWNGLTREESIALLHQLQSGLIWFMLLSLPFLLVPSIGYLRNGSGFQGLLNHPQAYGSTIAVFGALVGGRILSVEKPRWRDFSIFLLCAVLVFLTAARTAVAAMFLGLCGVIILMPLLSRESMRMNMPGLHSPKVRAVFLLTIAVALISGPLIIDQVSSFVFKGSGSDSLTDAADASRGFVVYRMLANIQAQPLTGIGFGIGSSPESMVVERDPLFGMPLSAPIEKGVLPIAILEELGVFGALAVIGWFYFGLRRCAAAGASQLATLLTVLLTNLGEYTLFSVGGMGMLMLIFYTSSINSERHPQGAPKNV